MATRRSLKRRNGGSRSDLLIEDGEIIILGCKDCFFGVPVEIETGLHLFEADKITSDTVHLIECRFDSPQPGQPNSDSTGRPTTIAPARKFPLMAFKHDWCGCFRPRNPKCKGNVHCTVNPKECGPDCKNHVDYEPQE